MNANIKEFSLKKHTPLQSNLTQSKEELSTTNSGDSMYFNQAQHSDETKPRQDKTRPGKKTRRICSYWCFFL